MQIHVDLAPDAAPTADELRVVVDVVGLGTIVPQLFRAGATSVVVVDGVRAARQVAAETGAVLVGARHGVPPEGFNHGASSSALHGVRFDGRRVALLAPSDGRLASLVRGTRVAGFGNAVAVAASVLASEAGFVRIVCGRAAGPDLGDTVAAGLLVNLLVRGAPDATAVSGAATYCASVLRSVKDPLDALWVSERGATLRALGLEDDLARASEVGVEDDVPVVVTVGAVGDRAAVELASGT